MLNAFLSCLHAWQELSSSCVDAAADGTWRPSGATTVGGERESRQTVLV